MSQVKLIIPDKIYARAKQLTQVRKEKSADELVELLEQILASAEQSEVEVDEEDWAEEDPAVAREMQAYIAMHPLLKKTHLGKHIAIYESRLIDSDVDYDRLTRRIDDHYPDRFVWISTVEEESIQTFVFRSPRLEEVG